MFCIAQISEPNRLSWIRYARTEVIEVSIEVQATSQQLYL